MSLPVERRRALLNLLFLAWAAGAAAIAAAAFFGRWSRPLDTFGQLAAPALTLAILGAGLAFWRGRWACGVALVVAGSLLAAELQPQWRSAPPPTAAKGAQTVKVYFNNIAVQNRDGKAMARSVAAAGADVAAFVDVSDGNLVAASQALSAYPYQLACLNQSKAGPNRTLVAARYPLVRRESPYARWERWPGCEMAVLAPQPFDLVVVHLQRPWPAEHQPLQFEGLRQRLITGGAEDRTLIVGDFNATLSSAVMRRFVRKIDFTAAAAPVGDWPAVLPGPLRIAIENALVGKGLTIRNRKLGAPSGSDHRPIVFEIAQAARGD